MISQTKVMKILINVLGVQTGFEQFQDVFATLGLSFSYDGSLKPQTCLQFLKQAGQFSELAANYGFSLIEEIGPLCQQMVT